MEEIELTDRGQKVGADVAGLKRLTLRRIRGGSVLGVEDDLRTLPSLSGCRP
jgi:hypothetical protein